MNNLNFGSVVNQGSNARAISTAIDQLRNEDWLSPGDGVVTSGGAGAFAVKDSRYPAVSMPDAVSTNWFVSRYWRPWWIQGTFSVDVFFTSSTGSTATFDLLVQLYSLESGDVTSSGPLELSDASSVAGPSVADTVQIHSVSFSTGVSVPLGLVSWKIVRNGAADTNNNSLSILGARVVFKEEARR